MDTPHTRLVCPTCSSQDVRIDVLIPITLKPNDERDPIVDPQFVGLDADWEDTSHAWCACCGWDGVAGELIQVEQESAP